MTPEKHLEIQAIWHGLTEENREAMLDYLEMNDIAYREENCIPFERDTGEDEDNEEEE